MGGSDVDDIFSQLEKTYSLLKARDISIELDGLTLDIVGVVCASRLVSSVYWLMFSHILSKIWLSNNHCFGFTSVLENRQGCP